LGGQAFGLYGAGRCRGQPGEELRVGGEQRRPLDDESEVICGGHGQDWRSGEVCSVDCHHPFGAVAGGFDESGGIHVQGVAYVREETAHGAFPDGLGADARHQFGLDTGAGGGGALPGRQVHGEADRDRDGDVDHERDDVVTCFHGQRVIRRDEEEVDRQVGGDRRRQ
jgi:hypothetical protein